MQNGMFLKKDGKKALEYAKGKKTLSNNFLKTICPKIVRGVKELRKWIQEN